MILKSLVCWIKASGVLLQDVSEIRQDYLNGLKLLKKPNFQSLNRSIIKLLLHISQDLWKCRSDILHNKAPITQEAVLRNQAIALVRSLRTTPYSLPHAKRKLFDCTSHYLSTTPLNNVVLRTNRINMAIEEQTFLEKTSSNDIQIWMHTGKIDSRQNCMNMKAPDGCP